MGVGRLSEPSMLKEFRDFIANGNVLDLAVGIIIGAAFTGIVGSFVKDVINPIIGLAGKANFDNLFLVMRDGAQPGPYLTPDAAEKAGAVVLKYGSFLTNVLNFLIIAFVIFLIVKAANKARKQADPPAAGPTKSEELLTEIRDLLKAKSP
jgi:large conductance mechanosensitive channel